MSEEPKPTAAEINTEAMLRVFVDARAHQVAARLFGCSTAVVVSPTARAVIDAIHAECAAKTRRVANAGMEEMGFVQTDRSARDERAWCVHQEPLVWCEISSDSILLYEPTRMVTQCGKQPLVEAIAWRAPTCPECLAKMEAASER